MGRKLARVVALLLLAFTGVIGIHNGIVERSNDYTAFQRAVYVGVVLYGILGLTAAYGVLRRRRWAVGVAVAWAAVVTCVSATAAAAYAGNDASIGGAVAAGLATALVGAGVVWAVSRDRGR